VRPRVISRVCTPISGMVKETGRATDCGAADSGAAVCGAAANVPVGAGMAATAAGAGVRAADPGRLTPQAAVTITMRPAAKTAAAARWTRVPGRCHGPERFCRTSACI
jgi:hypothetical protein